MKVSPPLASWNFHQPLYRPVNAKKGNMLDKDRLVIEEEIEALYRSRPPSLTVTESGKKERDPIYHCIMEKIRRRTMKAAINGLKKALSKSPQRLSLQTVLEGALKEVKVLKERKTIQQEVLSDLKEKKNALESKLTELTGDHIPSSRSVIVLDEEDRGYCTPSTTTLTNPSTNCSVSEDEDEGMDSPGCMSNTSSISNLSHSESGISSLSSSSQFQFSPKPVVQPTMYFRPMSTPVTQQLQVPVIMYPFMPSTSLSTTPFSRGGVNLCTRLAVMPHKPINYIPQPQLVQYIRTS